MKDRLNGHRLGLVLGTFSLIVHVIWVLAVLLGLAQAWIDTIFRLHMMRTAIMVEPINWGYAVMLWVVVWIVGYLLGQIFAWVHNFVHKR